MIGYSTLLRVAPKPEGLTKGHPTAVKAAVSSALEVERHEERSCANDALVAAELRTEPLLGPLP